MAGYIAQAAGFGLFGAGLSAYALYDDIKYADRKRKFSAITPPPSPKFGKQSRPNPTAIGGARTSMFRRSRFRRRFKRRRPTFRRSRVKRVLRSARRRSFKRSVQKIVLRTAELKKKQYTETSFNLAPGNGTTGMNVRIFAPWQSAFTQGTGSGQMIGSRARIFKFQWRIHMQNLVAGDIHVQIVFFSSDFQMDVTNAGTDINNEGTTMTPATTTVLVPTQVAPNGNIPMFDMTATPGQFAGLSSVSKYNTDNIKILKIHNFKITGFGQAATDGFLDTSLTFPFKKDVQIQETQETIDGVPRFFGPMGARKSYTQYYAAVRVWSQSFQSATDHLTMRHRGVLLYQDI